MIEYSNEQKQLLDSRLSDLKISYQDKVIDGDLSWAQLEKSDKYTGFNKLIFCSDFALKTFKQSPELLTQFFEDEITSVDLQDTFFEQKRELLLSVPNEMELEQGLRRLRQYHMLRFIYRDCNRLCSTVQLVRELSLFADFTITVAKDWHYQSLAEKYGKPLCDNGVVQDLLILGMGKLGAFELNLSSDIDLIFAYPKLGFTDGKKTIANQQFFLKLGQGIIRSLDKVTADGFVFRVDMRLRPYGQSGSLASSFDALELYYEEQGREWERYAMIKARPIEDNEKSQELMQRLRPFVYRKYTDFSAIESLREMKSLITKEVKRLGKEMDVKLGAGGIREIEFIAQVYQLIYGGRDESLQTRSLLEVLRLLSEKNMLPDGAAEELRDAYLFLRNVEHGIQALNDEQTQKIPSDIVLYQQLLFYLDFPAEKDFVDQLNFHRDNVSKHFANVIAESEQQEQEVSEDYKVLWRVDIDSEVFSHELTDAGFSDEEVTLLVDFKADEKVLRLENISLERLQSFMPKLFSAMLDDDSRGYALKHLLDLIHAILRRTTYLVLLNENPIAIKRLITIAKASPWVISQIVKHPVLLDELITDQGLGQVPNSDDLVMGLNLQGLRIPDDDVEEQMMMLRYFKLAHHLHIVAAEVNGDLPLMKVSDYLTFLADSILAYVMKLSWSQMVNKYGFPMRDGEVCSEPDFAIVAYGKLGGIELSHSSDLDLVFLYDADDLGETDGEKSIVNRQFFTRMGQRIIHILSTQTMLGQLYEVDMRLRPSGGKGLLVSSINAFDKYQSEKAWIWEHQALVRGRSVAGDGRLIAEFEKIRQRELTKSRDIAELKEEVQKMRFKMFDHLAPNECKNDDAEFFHLKHSRGGIVDVEFMVQFCVLAFGQEFPELARFTDNIRILETLTHTGLIPAEKTQQVIETYKFYRSLGHKLALKQEKNIVAVQQVQQQRNIVLSYWDELFSAV